MKENLRIVSLIASATEIISELGYGSYLVGRSHECDYPPFVENLPVCTRPKIKINGRSPEIDKEVKTLIEQALSVYHVDSTTLNQLKPTHIITQSHCEVCAVSLADVEKALRKLTDSNPAVVSLEPNSLEDIWSGIVEVGRALGDIDGAKEAIARLKRRMSHITEKTSLIQIRPTVACIEWIEPLMVSGNWMPELVEMAGGINLFGQAGKHSPLMSWDQIVQKDPQIILILPCGFDIPRTYSEMDFLTAKPEWKKLQAALNQSIFILDGNQFFNRPGPRLVESLQILAEIFHPEIFHFGFEEKGWIRHS